jgi:integrase
MDKAVRAGYAPTNPVRQLNKDERPKIRPAEKRPLDEAEIGQLLRTAGDTFRPLIAFMLFTGVRLGEALGARWQDIDLAEGFVHVRDQLGRDRQRGRVKTEAGRRDVVLIPDLARVLRAHKLKSPFSTPTDYVFAAPDGSPRDHRSTSRGIERAVKRAKIEGVSAHNFRHTYASLLIVGLGQEAVVVSKQLGHTKASFTQDTYTHMFDKARHAAKLRDDFQKGFGHHLVSTAMSTGGRNEAQDEPVTEASISLISG